MGKERSAGCKSTGNEVTVVNRCIPVLLQIHFYAFSISLFADTAPFLHCKFQSDELLARMSDEQIRV